MQPKNKQNLSQAAKPDQEGACIITFGNGSKECVTNKTEDVCSSICDEESGSDYQWSQENTCPRGQ